MIGSLSAVQAERREFWGELCPGMSIDAGGYARPAAVVEIDPLLANLKRAGCVQVPGALPEATIAPIRYAVSTSFQRGIPLAFAFVYDELWLFKVFRDS